jgi:hypothetical protein
VIRTARVRAGQKKEHYERPQIRVRSRTSPATGANSTGAIGGADAASSRLHSKYALCFEVVLRYRIA